MTYYQEPSGYYRDNYARENEVRNFNSSSMFGVGAGPSGSNGDDLGHDSDYDEEINKGLNASADPADFNDEYYEDDYDDFPPEEPHGEIPAWYSEIIRKKRAEAEGRLINLSSLCCYACGKARDHIKQLESDHRTPFCKLNPTRHPPLTKPWMNFWKFNCVIKCNADPSERNHAHTVNCEEVLLEHVDTGVSSKSLNIFSMEFPEYVMHTVEVFQKFANRTLHQNDDDSSTVSEKPTWTFVKIRSNYKNEIMLIVGGKGVTRLLGDLKRYFNQGPGRACNVVSLYCVNRWSQKKTIVAPTFIYGDFELRDKVGPISINYSPKTDMHFNSVEALQLGRIMMEYLEPTLETTVVDIGCNFGVLSLMLAQKSDKVIGLTLENDVKLAENLKQYNNLHNASFIACRPEEVHTKCSSLVKKCISVAILNLSTPFGKNPNVMRALRNLPTIWRVALYGTFTKEFYKHITMLTSTDPNMGDEFLPMQGCILDNSPSIQNAFEIIILFERKSLIEPSVQLFAAGPTLNVKVDMDFKDVVTKGEKGLSADVKPEFIDRGYEKFGMYDRPKWPMDKTKPDSTIFTSSNKKPERPPPPPVPAGPIEIPMFGQLKKVFDPLIPKSENPSFSYTTFKKEEKSNIPVLPLVTNERDPRLARMDRHKTEEKSNIPALPLAVKNERDPRLARTMDRYSDIPSESRGRREYNVPPPTVPIPDNRYDCPPRIKQEHRREYNVPPPAVPIQDNRFDCPPRIKQERRFDSPPRERRQPRFDSPTRERRETRVDSPSREKRKSRYDSPPRVKRERRGDSPSRGKRKSRFDSPPRVKRERRGDSPSRVKRERRGDSPPRVKRERRSDSPSREKRERRSDSPSREKRRSRHHSPSREKRKSRFDSPSREKRRSRIDSPPWVKQETIIEPPPIVKQEPQFDASPVSVCFTSTPRSPSPVAGEVIPHSIALVKTEPSDLPPLPANPVEPPALSSFDKGPGRPSTNITVIPTKHLLAVNIKPEPIDFDLPAHSPVDTGPSQPSANITVIPTEHLLTVNIKPEPIDFDLPAHSPVDTEPSQPSANVTLIPTEHLLAVNIKPEPMDLELPEYSSGDTEPGETSTTNVTVISPTEQPLIVDIKPEPVDLELTVPSPADKEPVELSTADVTVISPTDQPLVVDIKPEPMDLELPPYALVDKESGEPSTDGTASPTRIDPAPLAKQEQQLEASSVSVCLTSTPRSPSPDADEVSPDSAHLVIAEPSDLPPPPENPTDTSASSTLKVELPAPAMADKEPSELSTVDGIVSITEQPVAVDIKPEPVDLELPAHSTVDKEPGEVSNTAGTVSPAEQLAVDLKPEPVDLEIPVPSPVDKEPVELSTTNVTVISPTEQPLAVEIKPEAVNLELPTNSPADKVPVERSTTNVTVISPTEQPLIVDIKPEPVDLELPVPSPAAKEPVELSTADVTVSPTEQPLIVTIKPEPLDIVEDYEQLINGDVDVPVMPENESLELESTHISPEVSVKSEPMDPNDFPEGTPPATPTVPSTSSDIFEYAVPLATFIKQEKRVPIRDLDTCKDLDEFMNMPTPAHYPAALANRDVPPPPTSANFTNVDGFEFAVKLNQSYLGAPVLESVKKESGGEK